jgi:hypothetical protein
MAPSTQAASPASTRAAAGRGKTAPGAGRGRGSGGKTAVGAGRGVGLRRHR